VNPPTLILVHGAGDSARVWQATQSHLCTPSLALDLLGRATRPFDITRVTIDLAAAQASADVRSHTSGPVVIVAHSAGGVVAPRLVGLLGRQVRSLVLIAGVTAAEGAIAADLVHPERRQQFLDARPKLLARHRGRSYARGAAVNELPADLEVLSDPEVVRAVESLNFMFQPISWAGVPDDLPRTFIRPLRDQMQSRETQARLAVASGAHEVIDIDADHTPARSAPRELALLLDELALRHAAPS
jgi:pimeloyl-ACP methyl ester carboxylesterase